MYQKLVSIIEKVDDFDGTRPPVDESQRVEASEQGRVVGATSTHNDDDIRIASTMMITKTPTTSPVLVPEKKILQAPQTPPAKALAQQSTIRMSTPERSPARKKSRDLRVSDYYNMTAEEREAVAAAYESEDGGMEGPAMTSPQQKGATTGINGKRAVAVVDDGTATTPTTTRGIVEGLTTLGAFSDAVPKGFDGFAAATSPSQPIALQHALTANALKDTIISDLRASLSQKDTEMAKLTLWLQRLQQKVNRLEVALPRAVNPKSRTDEEGAEENDEHDEPLPDAEEVRNRWVDVARSDTIAHLQTVVGALSRALKESQTLNAQWKHSQSLKNTAATEETTIAAGISTNSNADNGETQVKKEDNEEDSASLRLRVQELAADAARRKSELLRVSSKMSTMLKLLTERNDECTQLRLQLQEMEARNAAASRRDSPASPSVGADTASVVIPNADVVEHSRVYQSLDRRKWWGKGIQRGMSSVDIATLHVGRFLRRHSFVRLFIAIYVVLIHLYVFHMTHIGVHNLHESSATTDVHEHLRQINSK